GARGAAHADRPPPRVRGRRVRPQCLPAPRRSQVGRLVLRRVRPRVHERHLAQRGARPDGSGQLGRRHHDRAHPNRGAAGVIAAIAASTLTLLKVGFLVLLYLFFFRAIRVVYLEISPKRNAPIVPTVPGPAAAKAAPPATK